MQAQVRPLLINRCANVVLTVICDAIACFSSGWSVYSPFGRVGFPVSFVSEHICLHKSVLRAVVVLIFVF